MALSQNQKNDSNLCFGKDLLSIRLDKFKSLDCDGALQKKNQSQVTKDIASGQNDPAIVGAILENNIEAIKTLVANGVDLNECPAKLTKPPLLVAVAKGANAETIHCLLDLGASLDCRDLHQQNNSLHIACSYCREDLALILYERGVDFNAVNDLGETPLCKLLQRVTKSETDFGNRMRLELAKKLIALGFLLPPRSIHCRCSSMKRKSKNSKRINNTVTANIETRTEALSTNNTKLNTYITLQAQISSNSQAFSANKPEIQSGKKTGCSRCLLSGKGPLSLSEEEMVAFQENVFPSRDDRVQRKYWEVTRTLRSSMALQDHCRVVILRSILQGFSELPSAVSTLGVPRLIKRFLINREFD